MESHGIKKEHDYNDMSNRIMKACDILNRFLFDSFHFNELLVFYRTVFDVAWTFKSFWYKCLIWKLKNPHYIL